MSSGESNTETQNNEAADPKSLRAGYWENLRISLARIREAVQIEGKRLRGSDYVSIALVPISSVALAVCSSNPAGLHVRPYLVLLFAATLIYFIGGRIGIVRAMTLRQTYLFFVVTCISFLLGGVFAMMWIDMVRWLQPGL